ncbi:hypothetical protein L6164_030279 [Bauhinia variegata]|uniref:Uncharacterized protein n=1 Tax=Bauhinia variegata TaxID=167791 RepID=A0ACB9LD57_BAUVA|nr:hypothetical protein L6164_030279 [Bauhinia variegata]
MIFVSALPLLDCAFDITTFVFIAALLVLSVLSCCFVFHLRLKSKILTHLQDFNSLWTVRLLLVAFIFLWAIVELFRSPFFRRRYLYSFLPSVDINQQDKFCKAHIILSLGFFEPAFLVILLYLLSASIRKKTPNDIWAITFVAITCLPVTTVQAILILLEPLENRLPGFFRLTSTSIVLRNGAGNETVLCAFPLLNSIAFGAFGIAYAIWFVVSSWKVLSLVINKGLRRRIHELSLTILIALLLQIVSLMLTNFWDPDEVAYGVASLVAFLGAFACAAAGQGIMVIKPISDALDAGGSCCRWSRSNTETTEEEPKGTMNRTGCNLRNQG